MSNSLHRFTGYLFCDRRKEAKENATYLTSLSCPLPTSSAYPMTGISFLTYGLAFRTAISARTFVSTVPGDHAQPIPFRKHQFLANLFAVLSTHPLDDRAVNVPLCCTIIIMRIRVA